VKILALLFLVLVIASNESNAQKQLILLNRERVLLRLNPGDEFIFKLKGSKTIRRSYVNNLSDTAVVAHHDIIPFHRIDRVYFSQTKFYNLLGGALVIGGAGLLIIDQVNQVIVQGNKFSLDDGVTTFSIAAVATGLPLMLIRKKSQKISYRFRLMTVEEGSVFYVPDPRGYQSPYMNDGN
jgi:hypothetical protein